MSGLPEDEDSASDGEEDRGSRLRNQPQEPPRLAEEAAPELSVGAEEPFSDEASEKPMGALAHDASSPGPSEEDVSKDSEEDRSTEATTPPRVSEEVELETLRDLGGGISEGQAVSGADKHEQVDLEPSRETEPQEAEDVIVESLKKSDQALPEDPEVLGPTISELRVGFPEEAQEGSLTKQHDRTKPERVEQTEPEFLSGELRISMENADLQPPELTKADVPRETQRKSPEEERTEPSEQVKPEVPEEEPRKHTEETAQEPLVETKAETSEEIQGKSAKESGTKPSEQTKAESPEETQRKPSEELGTELSEQVKPEFPGEEPRKPTEEAAAQKPLEETKAETPEETQRKSAEKLGTELLEQAKPEFPEERKRKSIVESGTEPSEQTKPEFPEEKQRKTTEELGTEPSEQTKPEFQEERQRKSDELLGTEVSEHTVAEFPKETQRKSNEVLGKEASEHTVAEFPEETHRKSDEVLGKEASEHTVAEFPEDTHRKSPEYKRTEPSKQVKPEFSEEEPRKSIGEAEPPEQTKAEFPEEIQRKSDKELGTEPSELVKPEFPEEEARKSLDFQEPLEEAKAETPEETQKKSTEELRTIPQDLVKPEFSEERKKKSIESGTEPSEQTKVKFPEDKPNLSTEDTQRKSTREKVPDSLDKTKSKFSKEKLRKSIEEDFKPSEKTKLERTQIAEKVLESLEDIRPTDQKYEARKLSEHIASIIQEFNPEESLTKLSEIGGRPLGQTKLEVPKKKLEESVEDISQVSPQRNKLGVQEESETELTQTIELLYTVLSQFRGEKRIEYKEEQQEAKKFKRYAKVRLEQLRKRKISFKEYHRYSRGSDFTESRTSEASLSLQQDFYPDLQNFTVFSDSCQGSLQSEESEESFRESSVGSPKSEELKSEESSELPAEVLEWSPENVAAWISQLGFPQYKECFTTNFISGRKLIHVNCSNLPQMGITDFEDMKVISRHVRELLGIEEPVFRRSIRFPYRDNVGLFLEQKAHSGEHSDSLTFSEFVEKARLQDYAVKATDPVKVLTDTEQLSEKLHKLKRSS
ncbi:sterile alpha motif domain-containing protein 15 isoform X1 [Sorex araneus]|uniref:sterile alpha motif domain-containing protein 15 isoform X1 n=1 Tax=Sorex araneus TaxID=42254 RepID=UPI0024335A0B|nr:sterile alpha motif domain-containing protein 15 isoform X1 [Sorex araneus]